MANTAGGHIVYGILDRRGPDKQSTGIPDGMAALKIENPQSDIARLSSLISDGIAPRLMGVTMEVAPNAKGDVLVIRVPRSWNAPHMVTIARTNKFVRRTSTGKEFMRVEEVRMAFSEQGELAERIMRWRSHRGR
jgi:Putative DNA-binding domain